MDPAALRSLISQIADDLSWLEDHSRGQAENSAHTARLRLAAAMVRSLVGPYLGDQPAAPLHVAVVGGAGAGKSTIANMLSGTVLAEANPQAGFTRHPVAYTCVNGQITWPSHLGFLGPLQRLTAPTAANLDADVYQIRRVPAEAGVFSLLEDFVIWDCPDMTTWAAGGYVSRLIEVAGLADVIVYVASDERYNDEEPTQFLQMLVEAGKVVIVCLVKMAEENAPALVGHFQKEVLHKLSGNIVSCMAIPHLTQEQLADPVHQAAPYRIPLVNQVAVLGKPAAIARRRSVQTAVSYLENSQYELLSVARNDLAAMQSWRALVHEGQIEFDNRYRREYLAGERFHRFDEALIRLLELLELPGVGKLLSTTLWVVRTPYRLLKTLFTKALRRPEVPAIPERPVLEMALGGWLDMLRKEAARRSDSHSLWAHVNQGFSSGLAERAQERFAEGFRSFQLSQADEVDRTARAIYEDLEKNPVALNTLRGTKFALELAAITGTIVAGGINVWDVVLVPLAASVTHQLIELLGMQYVDSQREQARIRQQALVTQHLSGPLAEWLAQWPATGGSTFERLYLALRRLPGNIEQLQAAVAGRPEVS